MNPLTELLRPYVKDLMASDSPHARDTIALYKMHCDQPNDPGAPVFCEAAFKDWLAEEAQTEKRTRK